MPASTTRNALLRARLSRFTRTLPRLGRADIHAVVPGWEAARRLREVLPILQVTSDTVRKLSTRLKKLGRRLGTVAESEALLDLLEQLQASERRGRGAFNTLRQDVQRRAERNRKNLFRRKTAHELERLASKLGHVVQTLQLEADGRTRDRDARWAVNARLARRAQAVKDAVAAAGSVYLAERVRSVRTAVRKLRYGAEVASEFAGGVASADLRLLVRMENLLQRIRDLQRLIDRVRQVQSGLATPDLKAWRELDALITALDTRCRPLHARYVREREALVAVCDRFAARAPADGGAKRKAS